MPNILSLVDHLLTVQPIPVNPVFIPMSDREIKHLKTGDVVKKMGSLTEHMIHIGEGCLHDDLGSRDLPENLGKWQDGGPAPHGVA